MAGRILSIRLLRSLETSTLHSPSSPLKPSALLLSHSLLTNLLSSRFFSGRRASSNAGRKEKSLIEDEAELSDWIGDLKTDSLRISLSSDSEDEFNRRSDRVTGKFKGRENFRGGDRNAKSSRGSVKKRGFYSDEDEDEEGDCGEGFSPRGQRGGRGFRSGGGRKDLDFDFADEERGPSARGFSYRNKDGTAGRPERLRGGQRGQRGRGFDFSLSEKDKWDKSDDGFTSGMKGRGGSMSVRQRGGKASRGGRNLDFDLSEEETESDSDEGFSDFEEDSSQDKKDKMKEGLRGGDSGLSFEKSDDEERNENTVRGSSGEHDSYLSQKR